VFLFTVMSFSFNDDAQIGVWDMAKYVDYEPSFVIMFTECFIRGEETVFQMNMRGSPDVHKP